MLDEKSFPCKLRPKNYFQRFSGAQSVGRQIGRKSICKVAYSLGRNQINLYLAMMNLTFSSPLVRVQCDQIGRILKVLDDKVDVEK